MPGAGVLIRGRTDARPPSRAELRKAGKCADGGGGAEDLEVVPVHILRDASLPHLIEPMESVQAVCGRPA